MATLKLSKVSNKIDTAFVQRQNGTDPATRTGASLAGSIDAYIASRTKASENTISTT